MNDDIDPFQERGQARSIANVRENEAEMLHVLMVGDSMTDYEAACITGVRFVGIARPGTGSPFPQGTVVLPDLTRWERAIEDLSRRVTAEGYGAAWRSRRRGPCR